MHNLNNGPIKTNLPLLRNILPPSQPLPSGPIFGSAGGRREENLSGEISAPIRHKEQPGAVGRFAPSPTGALHIGSLVTAAGSWLAAKSSGGRWLLRIDDLDAPRLIQGSADDIQRTLEEFGLLWDGEISWQSRNHAAYVQAFDSLMAQGALYACSCSRKEIARSASAPHPNGDALPYPGTCRNGMPDGAAIRSWRARVPDKDICFHDLLQGRICRNLAEHGGDFVVRRGDGGFAYQLAVVMDDHLGGITQVARGNDLLPSTPRQIYLQQLLGLPCPEYCHLPLVTGPQGAKLSKRDNLVSHGLGNWKGKEGTLLLKALRFLGQNPPLLLEGAPCREILEWGKQNFDISCIPLGSNCLT